MTENSSAQLSTAEEALVQILSQREAFLRFLAKRVSDPSEAEDILQSAYMKAIEKNGQLRQAESVVAWFYRILRNALADHYRKSATQHHAQEQFIAEAPTSYEVEFEASLCTCVDAVVENLKPEYRVALQRIDLGGESVADFAHALKTNINNANVRLHRARKAAAKRLAQVCGACAEHKCLDCTCKRKV